MQIGIGCAGLHFDDIHSSSIERRGKGTGILFAYTITNEYKIHSSGKHLVDEGTSLQPVKQNSLQKLALTYELI